MSVDKKETVSIRSTDTKGSAYVEYNIANNLQIGNIQVKWLGSTLSFATISEYKGFITDVMVPLTNILWSPSGVGTGYTPATVGTQGDDKIVN